MQNIDTLIAIRHLLTNAIMSLTEKQWLNIPTQFDNNIAWNVGHINVVQQSVIYRLSGFDGYTTKAQARQFLPETSPKDWSTTPDIALLKQQTSTFGDQLKQDFSEGKFTEFTPYTTLAGFHLTSLEEAISFNNFHEGLHIGTILALINFV